MCPVLVFGFMTVCMVLWHMCLYSCGGQRLVSGVFFYPSPFCILRQSLPLTLELADSSRLADQEVPCILLALPLQSAIGAPSCMSGFSRGCRRCKRRSSYMSRILLTETSLQPLQQCVLKMITGYSVLLELITESANKGGGGG